MARRLQRLRTAAHAVALAHQVRVQLLQLFSGYDGFLRKSMLKVPGITLAIGNADLPSRIPWDTSLLDAKRPLCLPPALAGNPENFGCRYEGCATGYPSVVRICS